MAKRPRTQEMPCFVYVLGSRDKTGTRTYVGWTTDLERRLKQHNAGSGAKSTRGRTWILLHAEQYETRREVHEPGMASQARSEIPQALRAGHLVTRDPAIADTAGRACAAILAAARKA